MARLCRLRAELLGPRCDTMPAERCRLTNLAAGLNVPESTLRASPDSSARDPPIPLPSPCLLTPGITNDGEATLLPPSVSDTSSTNRMKPPRREPPPPEDTLRKRFLPRPGSQSDSEFA
eukprot:scaffold79236_cov32-Tisochrysis_lutea.AAC.3